MPPLKPGMDDKGPNLPGAKPAPKPANGGKRPNKPAPPAPSTGKRPMPNFKPGNAKSGGADVVKQFLDKYKAGAERRMI